jgi:hypothetical protein
MKNKKLVPTILVIVGLLTILIFFIIPILLSFVYPHAGIGIGPLYNCGIYDENNKVHSTCLCLGIQTRVDDYSRCWGYGVDYYE